MLHIPWELLPAEGECWKLLTTNWAVTLQIINEKMKFILLHIHLYFTIFFVTFSIICLVTAYLLLKLNTLHVRFEGIRR